MEDSHLDLSEIKDLRHLKNNLLLTENDVGHLMDDETGLLTKNR